MSFMRLWKVAKIKDSLKACFENVNILTAVVYFISLWVIYQKIACSVSSARQYIEKYLNIRGRWRRGSVDGAQWIMALFHND